MTEEIKREDRVPKPKITRCVVCLEPFANKQDYFCSGHLHVSRRATVVAKYHPRCEGRPNPSAAVCKPTSKAYRGCYGPVRSEHIVSEESR